MNILHLISSSGFYGAERMLVSLAQATKRMGANVSVAAFCVAGDPRPEILVHAAAAGVSVEDIPCSGRFDKGPVTYLRSLIQRLDIEIVHCHGYKADIYAYLARSGTSAALVSTCHNWPEPSRLMQFYAAVDRYILRRFDAVSGPSPRIREILQRSGIVASKVSYIPNGIDVSEFHNAPPALADGNPIVGFVGRFVNEKGGAVLIRAAKAVLDTCPDCRFLFAGEGPSEAKWRELAESLGVSDKVVFAGKRADMPNIYSSLSVLALPSFDEAMPMCVLEAMAAGKPVVASNVGAVPSLVLPGVTGYLVPAGNPELLAAKIIDLLRDPAKAMRFGKSGFHHVEANFSADTMAVHYQQFYTRALSGNGSLSAFKRATQN